MTIRIFVKNEFFFLQQNQVSKMCIQTWNIIFFLNTAAPTVVQTYEIIHKNISKMYKY